MRLAATAVTSATSPGRSLAKSEGLNRIPQEVFKKVLKANATQICRSAPQPVSRAAHPMLTEAGWALLESMHFARLLRLAKCRAAVLPGLFQS